MGIIIIIVASWQNSFWWMWMDYFKVKASTSHKIIVGECEV